MITEGGRAPAVTLPAYVDGERRRVDLGEYVGEGIVVLAFYPADFNPACTMQSSDLDNLDLFTMQKDVSVFAVSPDSTYSHAAFADRYSLHIPLLSDPDGEAAAAYGVATENDVGERLVERAVFVIDHRGVVQYAWSGEDIASEIDVAPVKRAVGDIGGDDTALKRYRVGYEHYVEGREAFTTAMSEYEDREWMVAFNEFEDAEPAFTAAADHFDTAVRFAETDDFETVVDRGEEKADTLQHAADWLADSADALASGRGKQGKEFRADADRLLEAASDLPEPPDPAAFTLTDDGIELADSIEVDPDEAEAYAWRANDPDAVDADLGLDEADLDAAVESGDADTDATTAEPADGDTVEGGDLEMDMAAVEAADAEAGADSEATPAADAAGESGGPTESESSIEGDTVEGDLEMDMDAIEAAEDEAAGTDGGEGASATGTTGAADSESAPLMRGGAGERDDGPTDPDAAASEGGPDGAPQPGESGGASGDHDPSDAEPDGAEKADPDAGGADADGDDEVEQLDLADPTESEDETDDEDERADWDIPGQ
jgi:peroxiredoxin